jgi:hypothetical protein
MKYAFKIGDKVKFHNCNNGDLNGKTGTVEDIETRSGTLPYGCFVNEFNSRFWFSESMMTKLEDKAMKFKVGDKVTNGYGDVCTVIQVRPDNPFPYRVSFDKTGREDGYRESSLTLIPSNDKGVEVMKDWLNECGVRVDIKNVRTVTFE